MHTRSLSGELQKKAEDELNEIPERVPKDLKLIREWLAKQQHLYARTDDQWLLNFVRTCQFDHQQTKEKMDVFYTMRTFLPELFSNRDPFLPEIQEALNRGIILPLRTTAGDAGPRVVIIRFHAVNSKLSFAAVVKTALMIVDLMMYEDDNAVIAGQHLFVDLDGVSLDCFRNMDADLCKKFEICLERAYSPKPKNFDFVNAPANFEMLFRLFEGFISERFRTMIHIHPEGTFDGISETVPRYLLPKEYGGEGDSLENLKAHWKRKVEGYKDWFLDDEQYRSDESKRPGKPRTSVEVFNTTCSAVV